MYLQLKTLFFFCLHFLQKGKRNHKLGRKKKRKTCFHVLEYAYVRLRYKMTVLVHNRCKQERSGKSWPWKIRGVQSVLLVWFSGWPAWSIGSMGRKGTEKNKMKWGTLSRACKFRQETGEWFELDAVWAILE